MSYKIDIRQRDEFEKHVCEGSSEGDWIIYRCTQCDYERRFHRRTGAMEVREGDPGVLHGGQFRPGGIDFSQLNAN